VWQPGNGRFIFLKSSGSVVLAGLTIGFHPLMTAMNSINRLGLGKVWFTELEAQ